MLRKRRWKPVSVLTGFLGSGKTTIIQHLLKQKEMAGTALIINEFGEVSVDHLLVETAEEKMVLLSNGCVCCSVRGDLVQAIVSLFERQREGSIPPFQRILLETSGLADPAPIVQSLIGPALRNYPVYFDSIATTVDSIHVQANLDEHTQIHSQIGVADSLLLTKKDLCPKNEYQKIRTLVETLNPRAQIHHSNHGVIAPAAVFGQRFLDPTASPRQMKPSAERLFSTSESAKSTPSHHQGIGSFVITREHPITYQTLDSFIRTLRSYKSADLLRVKGLVKVQGFEKSPTLIHGVQAVFHTPIRLKKWPTKTQRTQLVFITKNISKADIENMLKMLEGRFSP